MKAKHTPGPWEIRWTHTSCLITPKNGAHGYIAKVRFRPTKTDNLAEQAVNARLIAAAPDLLEALKDVCGFLKRSGYDTRIVKQAIKKAEE